MQGVSSQVGGIRLTQPVVNPKVGCNVPDKQVGHPIRLADPVEGAQGDQETEVAEQDQI